MEEFKLKLNGVEYTIKRSFRGLMQFEKLSNKSATDITDNLSDMILLLYCMLSASNQSTFKYSYDEFIDELDNNQNIFEDFQKYLIATAEKEGKKKVVKKG